MQVLSHPFRIGADGAAATVDDLADDFIDQTLSILVRTRLHERDMAWAWGIPSVAHTGLSSGDLQSVIDQYGPDGVTVTCTPTVIDDQTQRVEVTYRRDES